MLLFCFKFFICWLPIGKINVIVNKVSQDDEMIFTLQFLSPNSV